MPISSCKNLATTFSTVHLLHGLYGVQTPLAGVNSKPFRSTVKKCTDTTSLIQVTATDSVIVQSNSVCAVWSWHTSSTIPQSYNSHTQLFNIHYPADICVHIIRMTDQTGTVFSLHWHQKMTSRGRKRWRVHVLTQQLWITNCVTRHRQATSSCYNVSSISHYTTRWVVVKVLLAWTIDHLERTQEHVFLTNW